MDCTAGAGEQRALTGLVHFDVADWCVEEGQARQGTLPREVVMGGAEQKYALSEIPRQPDVRKCALH